MSITAEERFSAVKRQKEELSRQSDAISSIYWLLESIPRVGNSLADEIKLHHSKCDDAAFDLLLAHSHKSKLGKSLAKLGFGEFEICDGLGGIPGNIFMCVAGTIVATTEIKLALAYALYEGGAATQEAFWASLDHVDFIKATFDATREQYE